MRVKLAWLLGLSCAANGVFMLIAPAAWYEMIPGVAGTGPLNQHFVRDVGGAYLAAGGALVWFAMDVRARAAATVAAAFLGLHALVHVSDAIAGREPIEHVIADLLTIYLSALLALWIAWPKSRLETEGTNDAEMAVTAADRRVRKGV